MRHLVCGLLVSAALTGCVSRQRTLACERVVEALTVQPPKKGKTSNPAHLARAAERFEGAAARAAALTELPPEIAALSKEASQVLNTAAGQLRAAARARKASHGPDYATAKQKAEGARRALADVGARFDKVCNH